MASSGWGPLFSDPPSYEEFDPVHPADDRTTPEPSAPPPPPGYSNHGLTQLNYEQVVLWWNSLEGQQRNDMLRQGAQLSQQQIALLRQYYQQYFPKDYYPKIRVDPNQLGASDYYLIYYLYEEMMPQPSLRWMSDNVYFAKAFEVPPPPYQEPENVRKAPQHPPTPENAESWWKGLSVEQKQGFEQRSASYDREKIIVIRREFRPYYRYYYPHCCHSDRLNYYDYYLMSRYSSRFYGCPLFYDDLFFYNDMYLTIQMMRFAADGTVLMVRGGIAAAKLIGHGLAELGSGVLSHGGSSGGGSHCDGDGCKILIGLAILGGLLAAAISAVIASLYVSIKTASSLHNLGQGRKVARSLIRLGAMASGAYVGATQGMVVGAIVGSAIPGIGTAAGAIIGAIFGAPITAAIAGALTKHLTRLVSWWCTGTTNPEKWNVSVAQSAQTQHQGRFAMTTAEIQQLFVKLRQKKNHEHGSYLNPFKGSLLDPKNEAEKTRYNKFLEAIKQGHDPRSGIRVDKHTRFRFNSAQEVTRENVKLRKLVGGLTM